MTNSCTLHESPVADVLTALYADAKKQHAKAASRPRQERENDTRTPFERFSEMKTRYLPIGRAFGTLMYTLIRATRPTTIIEFGTSFGISTIFLAAAVRDNGAGKVITTEFIPEKAETAKQNLTDAGLVDWVEFRIGDAIETLAEPLPGPVDFLFLDGEKSMYVDVLKLLEPQMPAGALVASDNTDMDGTAELLAYVRDQSNGYVTAPLLTASGEDRTSGHEISLKL